MRVKRHVLACVPSSVPVCLQPSLAKPGMNVVMAGVADNHAFLHLLYDLMLRHILSHHGSDVVLLCRWINVVEVEIAGAGRFAAASPAMLILFYGSIPFICQ